MVISKVGNVGTLQLTVQEIFNLINVATYPLDITFVQPEDFARLSHDPFEDVLKSIPYQKILASRDSTVKSESLGYSEDRSPSLFNQKTELPNHEAFMECGSAACRQKMKQ